ncbi:hypothetical protein [Bacillus mycoides]
MKCGKTISRTIRRKVLWGFESAVTEESEKQELESTSGLLEDLFIHAR